MQIDNKDRAGKIKLTYMAVPLVLVIGVGIIYLVAEIRELYPAIIAAGIMGIFIIIVSLLKFSYISLFVGPEFIQFRFKTLSPFNTPNNSIKIKSSQLIKFEIIKKIGGLRKDLVLHINSPSGIAKYSPISLNGIEQEELDKLTKALTLIEAINKSAKKSK